MRSVGDLLEALVDGIREVERYGPIQHRFVPRSFVLRALYRTCKSRSN
jgi:hypothetical protein